MYILQQNLFSFEEWLKIEEGDRLKLFFSELDLRPYVRMLNASSPQGRKPINREAILRAFLASPQLGIDTFTGLYHRLKSDLKFRYRCGFAFVEDPPSVSVLSCVFSQIKAKGIAAQLFQDLVQRCKDLGIIKGNKVAVDSMAIDAYEKKRSKNNVKIRNGPVGERNSMSIEITLLGLDTRSTLRWIPKVNSQRPWKLQQQVFMIAKYFQTFFKNHECFIRHIFEDQTEPFQISQFF